MCLWSLMPVGLPWFKARRPGSALVVKPNLAELEEAVGRGLGTSSGPGGSGGPGGSDGSGTSGGPDLAAVERAAAELIGPAAGAATAIVVSLGGRGLLAITPDGTWHASLACPVAGNPTGAGDAVVAALVHGLVRRQPWPDRLRHAAALGAAAVVAPTAGEFHPDTYQRQLAEVRVTGRLDARGGAG